MYNFFKPKEKFCIKCGEKIPKGREIVHKYTFGFLGHLKPISYMHVACWCKYHSIHYKDFRDKKIKESIDEDICHICKRPKNSVGSIYCSYPHKKARVND